MPVHQLGYMSLHKNFSYSDEGSAIGRETCELGVST